MTKIFRRLLAPLSTSDLLRKVDLNLVSSVCWRHSLPAFVDCISYVVSHSNRYEALFGATCGASVLICPWIQRQRPARQLHPMSSLFLLDVYGWRPEVWIHENNNKTRD